jgi:Protein tyrosine and serine/threonine kinase
MAASNVSQEASDGGFVTIIVIVVVAVLIILGGLGLFVVFKNRSRSQPASEWSASASPGGSGSKNGSSSSELEQFYGETSLVKADTAIEYQNLLRNVVLGEVLGEGAFGKVYVGEYDDAKVAVKQIGSSSDDNSELLHELDMLTTIRSPYIVEFLGVALLEDRSMGMVMELCSLGSLDKMLRERGSQISEQGLIQCCLHIAKGTKAIHSASVLHRDIACRNVLVAESGVCKLAEYVVLFLPTPAVL